MNKQNIILKYLYENNCDTKFCSIRHLLIDWSKPDVINTLSVLREDGKIKISPESNFNGLGEKQIGILQTLEKTIITVAITDKGKNDYENSVDRSSTRTIAIIALIVSGLTFLFEICKFVIEAIFNNP